MGRSGGTGRRTASCLLRGGGSHSSAPGDREGPQTQLTFPSVLDVRIDNLQPVHLGALQRANGERVPIVASQLRRAGSRVDRHDLGCRIMLFEVLDALSNPLQNLQPSASPTHPLPSPVRSEKPTHLLVAIYSLHLRLRDPRSPHDGVPNLEGDHPSHGELRRPQRVDCFEHGPDARVLYRDEAVARRRGCHGVEYIWKWSLDGKKVEEELRGVPAMVGTGTSSTGPKKSLVTWGTPGSAAVARDGCRGSLPGGNRCPGGRGTRRGVAGPSLGWASGGNRLRRLTRGVADASSRSSQLSSSFLPPLPLSSSHSRPHFNFIVSSLPPQVV